MKADLLVLLAALRDWPRWQAPKLRVEVMSCFEARWTPHNRKIEGIATSNLQSPQCRFGWRRAFATVVTVVRCAQGPLRNAAKSWSRANSMSFSYLDSLFCSKAVVNCTAPRTDTWGNASLIFGLVG